MVIIRIINNIDKISDITSNKTRAFIVVIVRNVALTHFKNQANQVADTDVYIDNIPDGDISVLDRLTNEESYELIIQAIQTLPKSMSDVLYLSTVKDYDITKISKFLNLSYNTVKTRLSRAKKAIRKILTETGGVYGKQK